MVLALLCSGAIVGAAQAKSRIAAYEIFEISLKIAGKGSKPYVLTPGDGQAPAYVRASFDGPGGKRIDAEGFWDGQDFWKIRMAPTAVGEWHYEITSVNLGVNGKTGSFDCLQSNNRGFVRANGESGHHFNWEDGEAFAFHPAAMSVHAYRESAPGLFSYGGSMRDGSFQKYVDTRVSQGFTVMYWDMLISKWGQKCDCQVNEGGELFFNGDQDELNPAYFQWVDRRVQYALSKGLVPQLGLAWPDSLPKGWTHERLKRLWRYTIARYAAYNVTWNLFGEADEFGKDWLEIVREYGLLTKKWDPYDHPMTTHVTRAPDEPAAGKGWLRRIPTWLGIDDRSNGGGGLLTESWYDFIVLQLPTGRTSDYLKYGKPVVNAEYGGYEEYQVSGEELRPMLWDVRMRGGYPVYETWGNDLESAGARYAKHLNLFFRDRTSFWRLEYAPDIFDGSPGLVDPGAEYVSYLPAGGTISVDLAGASSSLLLAWYDPRTGESTEPTLVSGGGRLTFTAPDHRDWVLHIRAERK